MLIMLEEKSVVTFIAKYSCIIAMNHRLNIVLSPQTEQIISVSLMHIIQLQWNHFGG